MYYYFLKLLPFKIELNEGNNSNTDKKISVGFINDILKNIYVIKVIVEEFR